METLAPTAAAHEAGELVAGAQIAAHFFYHGCHLHAPAGEQPPRTAPGIAAASSVAAPLFVAEGILPELRAASAELSSVPCVIVHGRHDVVCPPRAAWRLHGVWPRSTLRIVEGGAHALFEKPMRAAVQAALAEFAGWGENGAEGGAGRVAKRRRG